MSTETSQQRVHRAVCPHCGAPVEFQSAASVMAVCGYCRSSLVRDAEGLRRIGQSAELFDDHSPLQLGVTGVHQGESFLLVGRVQYRYALGTWNEWHALLESGRSAWLSEDNGAHVFGVEVPLAGQPPLPDRLRAGAASTVNGQRWQVASVTTAEVIAAEGELPHPPVLGRSFVVADLRRGDRHVGTLDYSDSSQVLWTEGRSVALDVLKLQGLKVSTQGEDRAEKRIGARSLSCPNCGASVELKLSSTQSATCGQCQSVIDVSQGLGGDLRHYKQAQGLPPRIALGRVLRMALGSTEHFAWQVVGYARMVEVSTDPDDEPTPWDEYLLYHRSKGFAFLVDAEDGWSWSIPVTGAPKDQGERAEWRGKTYRLKYRYVGEVQYVLGEFYWQVKQKQRTAYADYRHGKLHLNREESKQGLHQEVVWSHGEVLPANEVQKAVGLKRSVTIPQDVSSSSRSWIVNLAWILFALVFAVSLWKSLFPRQTDCEWVRQSHGVSSREYAECVNERRSSGSGSGWWGGFSGGGSHK